MLPPETGIVRQLNLEFLAKVAFIHERDMECGWTLHIPDGKLLSICDAAIKFRAEDKPLVLLAGCEDGTQSSRDRAPRKPSLPGFRPVIAVEYEQIHRSNLVGMDVLPLQFRDGEDRSALGLTGHETFDVSGLGDGSAKSVQLNLIPLNGGPTARFAVRVSIDMPKEIEWYRHGGILQYALRQIPRP